MGTHVRFDTFLIAKQEVSQSFANFSQYFAGDMVLVGMCCPKEANVVRFFVVSFRLLFVNLFSFVKLSGLTLLIYLHKLEFV